jgi:hypothetical protein
MIYDLSNEMQVKEAETYFKYLTEKSAKCEIKQLRKKRSGQQNRYLHLLIGKFAMHFGYTMIEAKEIYKSVSCEIYKYTKKGRQFYRSSADLTTKEMTDSIEKFRQKSAENGCYLPSADEESFLMSIQNEIEKNQQYL